MGEEGRMKNLNWDLKLKLSCLDQVSAGEKLACILIDSR